MLLIMNGFQLSANMQTISIEEYTIPRSNTFLASMKRGVVEIFLGFRLNLVGIKPGDSCGCYGF